MPDRDLMVERAGQRTTAAASAVALPRMVRVAGELEQRPVPTVELGAFYAVEDRLVPATTVPVSPYGQAVEAVLAGDDDTLFAALRELLEFTAGCLDGGADASLYEQLAGDPNLVAQAEMDAALLRPRRTATRRPADPDRRPPDRIAIDRVQGPSSPVEQ